MTQREKQSDDGTSLISADKDLESGRRYRFRRLSIPIVLRDMYFNKDDPGPGDRLPDYRMMIQGKENTTWVLR